MTDNMQRARELLAEQYEQDSRSFTARMILSNPELLGENVDRALRAVAEALRLAVPEGMVVVPAVLTDEMLKAGHKSQWSAPPDTDYHGVPANTLNSIYQHIYAAQIAAAPTVSAEGEG